MNVRKVGAKILATKGKFQGCVGIVVDVIKKSFVVRWEGKNVAGVVGYSNLIELRDETGYKPYYGWEEILIKEK